MATNTLLVTATEESSGKTAVALALALLARDQGYTVGYMKPKGTRLQSVVGKTLDEDPVLARDLLDLDAEMHEFEPVVYSRTLAEQAVRGHEDSDELHQTVHTCCQTLATDRDLMIVEGGGKFTTGGIVHLTDPEVAELLDAEVLLLARYENVWDLDDVLAATERFGDRLVGVLFNAVADAYFDRVVSEVVPFLQSRNVPALGVIPRTRELAGVTVEDLTRELGAEVLTNEAPTDTFVERFLVGAMGSDSALQYFRRTKDAALITGGDRSDIQTVALEAPGVKCLVLTGGFRPSAAVLGKAEERNVPVLSVSLDTLTAIDRAEEVIRSGRTRDEQTVNRMRELLIEHADLEPLIGDGDTDRPAEKSPDADEETNGHGNAER